MKGGMQTQPIKALYCDCGLMTGRIIFVGNKKIALHFGKKSIYWHIIENGKIRRVFKEPEEWKNFDF